MKCLSFIFCALLLFTAPTLAFDHNYSQYGNFLKKHVVVEGAQSLVHYKEIKEDIETLNKILRPWQKVGLKDYEQWSSDQKLAFLINAYNGFTLKLIADNYPVKSIKDLGSFFVGPWKKEFFSLFGRKTHLDFIEHELIRKNFKEPRIHFAVNCASLGCPSLALEPYRAQDLNTQLERAARTFIQNTDRNHFDSKKKIASLSKIFKWYGDDFKKMTGTDFKTYIKKFVPPFKKDWQIDWLSYDWNLNEAPPKEKLK